MKILLPLALLLTTLSTAFAQAPALEIRALTAHSVPQETGKAFDIQLRFITNVPAVAEANAGPTKDAEKYPSNNHRLNLTGFTRSNPVEVSLTLTPSQGEKLTRTLNVAPPAPYPAAKPGKVELTITEPTGRDRKLLPVTAGIPLPKGALYRPENTRLGNLPLQARAEARWEDGSIKWLLLDTQIDLKANEKVKVTLDYGGSASASAPTNAIKVTDLSGRGGVYVTTGALEATLPLVGNAEFKGLGTMTSRLTDAAGRAYDFTPESVTVLEPGVLRTVVRMDGHYRDGDARHFMGSLLVTFYAGKPYARVDHVFGNDILAPGPTPATNHDLVPDMVAIKSLSLDLATAPSASATVGVVDANAIPARSGAQFVQQFDDKFAGAAAGKRLAGWVKTDAVSLAVKDFWQQYPKSFTFTDTGLRLGLCPEITPTDLYANKPDEEKLYYNLRDGNYTFRRGLMKRHELWLGPAAEADEVAALAARHATMTCQPAYYEQVQTAGHNLSTRPADFAMFDQILSTGIDSYLKQRDLDREYGLMNYGDWWGERRLNWGNIEYDLQVGMLQEYLRTGDLRFLYMGEASSRHNTEIDTIHWAPEPTRPPNQSYEPFPGEVWVHCMGHTGGYYPRNYKDMEVYSLGYATNRGHMWVGGNFLYGMLSGDPLVLDSARLSADWMSGPNCNNFDFGNAREPGWMGMAVMSAYRATRDPFYLNAADIMFTKVHEKAQATKPEYGLYYHILPSGHCDCPADQKHYGEAGFMAGVLMSSMKRFYEETGREQVADDIVGIAKLIVDTMWVPEENSFRYTSCPKTTVSSSSGGIIDEGLAFAANRTNNEELREIVRLSFANAMLALQSTGGGGKSAGYLLHSMPGAITEIGKFPGPSFAEYYQRQLREAQSPALATLPSLMPNPDFEEGINGWVPRTGFRLEPVSDITHSGHGAVRISGSGKLQNEYMVTRYACGPPWEIMGLQPGQKYRLSAWIRVDEITPGTPAVNLRCAIRDRGQTRDAYATTSYDLSKPGTWQRLTCEFTAPAYTTSAYVAINMNTKETVNIIMYADDLTLTSASVPEPSAVVYNAATAEQATLAGGARLTAAKSGPKWQMATGPGTATFKAAAPEGPSALWLRARNDGPDARLSLGSMGIAEIPEGPWQWIKVTRDGQPVTINATGDQTIAVTLPSGSKVGVQKIVLTNDLSR
ncbi:MAG: carbohydrate binding domain-containing protein [Armatimonadia bacterium]